MPNEFLGECAFVPSEGRCIFVCLLVKDAEDSLVVLPSEYMPDIRTSRESSVMLWVLSSYLVLRRVDSELIASKVTTSGLVGRKPSIALTAVKLGMMNAKAATRIVASNAQKAAISFLLDLRCGARTAVASVA